MDAVYYDKHTILGFVIIQKTANDTDGCLSKYPNGIKIKLWGITIYKKLPAKYQQSI